jgi:ribosome modulation factor
LQLRSKRASPSNTKIVSISLDPIVAFERYQTMKPDEPLLRDAYEAGLKSGQSEGVPDQCPFEVHDKMSERFAWLSGFSVGKAVRRLKYQS